MKIEDFIAKFQNHPILFVGTGLSLRYLENAYSWDSLLAKIAYDFKADEEYYLDLKAENMDGNKCSYQRVASQMEKDFNECLKNERHGKFEEINDLFYKNMRNGKNISRFKLYIASLLQETLFKKEMDAEISELKKARKNISSVITTNYDCLAEKIFAFNPLIGNDILLSNPYGAIYKIHGCISNPDKIIITDQDYKEFRERYELIRAQLLSMFIHNPIVFVGYNIGDQNIKDILKTIFSYIDYSSEESKRIRDNFLLVEYQKGSNSTDVVEHDIDLDGFPTIRINKLKTDNFTALYQALANLTLPVSAMDIRKVQTVVREICEGGNIKVSITENLDDLNNSDKVLVVGSKKTIKYDFQTTSEMMSNYFLIIEEANVQLLKLIDKQRIQSDQYFPIFGFAEICPEIEHKDTLKTQQKNKIEGLLRTVPMVCKGCHITPQKVLEDNQIPRTYKIIEMVYSVMNGMMDLDSVAIYLKDFTDKQSTDYRKLLCAYDLKRYG